MSRGDRIALPTIDSPSDLLIDSTIGLTATPDHSNDETSPYKDTYSSKSRLNQATRGSMWLGPFSRLLTYVYIVIPAPLACC
jgi:hypothetical protein